MDRRRAWGVIAALPLIWVLGEGLSALLPPLVAAGLLLLACWAGLAFGLRGAMDRDMARELLTLAPPGRLIALALALPVVLLGAATLRLLGQAPLPPQFIILAALVAVVHAPLSELFWRGALLPDPTPRAAAGALGLFWLAHLAWAGLAPLDTALPALLLVLGPLALGGAWTAARLASGTLGAGVLSHAGTALFLVAGTLAQGTPGGGQG